MSLCCKRLLIFNSLRLCGPPLAEVLEAVGQVVAQETGADVVGGLEQTMVEPLPCFVLVGEDMEYRFLLSTQVSQELHIFGFQQGGAGDGYGFPSRGEQGEAVCHSFREPKPFARSQSVHHGQTEDTALRTAGETEPWHACLMAQVAALDVHQPARAVAVGKEQRGGIVVGFPVPPARGLPIWR